MGTGNNVLLLVSIAVLIGSRQTDQADLMSHTRSSVPDYDNNVYHPEDFDEHQMASVSRIVESLENLDILGTSSSTCLTLERIDISRDTQGVVQIGFQLVIREWTGDNDGMAPNDLEPEGDRKSGCFTGSADSGGIPGGNSTANGTLSTAPPRGKPEKTPVDIPRTDVTKTRALDGHHRRRLSYTQIVVIATCAVVIGVFFFAAVGMRIRSYLKRIRTEEALARRPTFRSCSVALRNAQDRKGSDVKDERRDSDAVHLNLSNGGVREPLAESPSERGDPDVRPLIKGTPTSGPVAVFEHTNETNSGPLPTINRNKIPDFRRRSDPVHSMSSPPKSPVIPSTPPRVIVEDADQCLEMTLGGINNAYQSPTEEYKPSTCVNDDTLPNNRYTHSTDADRPDHVPYSCPQPKELRKDMQSKERLLDFRDWPPSTRAKPKPSQVKGDSQNSSKDDLSSDTVLTQSDSSISSENPSYRYGNQTEYTASHSNDKTPPDTGHGEHIDDQNQFDNVSFQFENEDNHSSLPTSIPIVRLDPAPKGRRQRKSVDIDSPVEEVLRSSSASDDDASDGESDCTVLLPDDSSTPTTPKDTLKVYDERSFLLGPEFEGMEPTYV